MRGKIGAILGGLVPEERDAGGEIAVYIEPIEAMVGFSRREQTDPASYGLRKFCSLALSGDLSALLILFAPEQALIECSDEGRALRGLAEQFALAAGRDRNLEYLRFERSRAAGSMAGGRREPAHGGSEAAMQALRVGHQAVELATRNTLTVPIPEPLRGHLLAVQRGEVSLLGIVNELDDLIGRLERAPLQGQIPDPELTIEQWMISTYLCRWQRTWHRMPLE